MMMRIGTDGKGVLATYIELYSHIYVLCSVQANKTNAEKTVGLTSEDGVYKITRWKYIIYIYI